MSSLKKSQTYRPYGTGGAKNNLKHSKTHMSNADLQGLAFRESELHEEQ
jgi:hypothetical protein